MSLHVKKINHQFSVLKKARVIGLFSCTWLLFQAQVLSNASVPKGDCPVMSGFFHAHKEENIMAAKKTNAWLK